MPGPMGTVLKVFYIPGIIAFLPPIEGLRRDAKIATGETSISTTKVVVIKPFQSLPDFLG